MKENLKKNIYNIQEKDFFEMEKDKKLMYGVKPVKRIQQNERNWEVVPSKKRKTQKEWKTWKQNNKGIK